MADLEAEWASFCVTGNCTFDYPNHSTYVETKTIDYNDRVTPTPMSSVKDTSSPLYISTTTKISFLNIPISLNTVFWKIPIIPYYSPQEGVIKKQMKVSSTSEDELQSTINKLDLVGGHIQHHIITRVVNPDGRVKYKDIRKISVGLCKKDIQSHRSREKSAFYNCFVMILRIKDEDDNFKEIHVKVFNTGKLEIPGIQSESMLIKTLDLTKTILYSVIKDDNLVMADKMDYLGDAETVLINSNFNCGFHIDRQELYGLIKSKYRLCCNFDPCSYPGVQCKYFYSKDTDNTFAGRKDPNSSDQSKISFMVFRTGSVLIVGKCTEATLIAVFERIKSLLIQNRTHILDVSSDSSEVDLKSNTSQDECKNDGVSKKRLRRFIKVTMDY